jgi:hypothetical protein
VIDRLARTLLYEGYVLYPYRASSTKNRQRFNFGTLYPRAWCEAERSDDHALQIEVLVTTRELDSVAISVRFLQPVGGERADGWQEAREHAIDLVAGPGVHTRIDRDGLGVAIELTATPDDRDTMRMRVRISNETPIALPRDDDPRVRRRAVQSQTLASTHVICRGSPGTFVSLLDPPTALVAAAARCEHFGAWPVLVGAPGATDAMLGSPLILYDYPTIAPESAGDLYDATEIDEILTLRVLALSDAEKEQVRALDPRARAILDRCERLEPAELGALHGAIRTRRRDGLAIGDRVVVRPSSPTQDVRTDALDSLLGGKQAEIVEVVEPIDSDDALFAVVFDDDPGRDFGVAGTPGHRFFFRAAELELLT